MILAELHQSESRQSIMAGHRMNYNKFKALVQERKFDMINIKQITKEKDLVIQHLNNCQNEDMMDQFEELSFYQEKYLLLWKFLTSRNQKIEKGLTVSPEEIDKVVPAFEESLDTIQSQIKVKGKGMTSNNENGRNAYKHTDSIEFDDRKESPTIRVNPQKVANLGIGSALFQFFEQKQRQSKTVGFKDLIEKRSNLSTSSKPFAKKSKAPTHDVEIRKLLEENKRLHTQLEKRSKEDVELNQFQKNVLREEKERCMKRIEELEEQVEELAKNNYKLQEIERSRKAATTFINEDSAQNSRSEFLPYYMKPRPNDLQVITENNKLAKVQGGQKDKILMKLVSDIPPIEKKEQISFNDQIQYEGPRSPQMENNILAGLLEDHEEKPKRQIFTNDRNLKLQSRNLMSAGEEVRYSHPQSRGNINFRPNDSAENISKFDSFSMAHTAYNNSSLFMNASKNQIAIDSITSTRNKVAFFKNSLVIFRDQDYEIAFKKSNVDSTYSQIRVIFYINNKGHNTQPVNIEYDYETMYYNFRITEKLKTVGPNQQGREVVEINLIPKCPDLNSVVDVHFYVGERRFDLWVPICFVVWGRESVIEASEMGFMTVQPDRQFSSYENMAKILPLTQKIIKASDECQAFLFGRSRFGNHEVKLTWWQKQLTIDASNKILDLLGFIMHHFK